MRKYHNPDYDFGYPEETEALVTQFEDDEDAVCRCMEAKEPPDETPDWMKELGLRYAYAVYQHGVLQHYEPRATFQPTIKGAHEVTVSCTHENTMKWCGGTWRATCPDCGTKVVRGWVEDKA